MNVCMLVDTDLSHDARVWREAKTLARDGHSVTVLAAYNPALPEQETAHGVTVIRVVPRALRDGDPEVTKNPSRQTPGNVVQLMPARARGFRRARDLLWDARMKWSILRHVRRIRPDVLHLHDCNRLFIGGLVHFLTGIPFCYDSHEYVVGTFPDGRRFRNWRRCWLGLCERILAPRALAVITTNEVTRDRMARRYPIRRFVVLHNYPELRDVEDTCDILRAAIPERHRHRPLLLYQGRLTPQRGIETFVEVVGRVPEAAGVIIGSGPLEQRLKETAASLGLHDRLVFIPQVPWDQLLRFTAGADIGFCLTQNTCENNRIAEPNKVFEYLMVGVPVVASDFPGLRACVVDAGVGDVAPPDDADAIARCVSRLLASPETLQRMKRQAIVAARTRYHWEATSAELTRFYRDMAVRKEREMPQCQR